MDEPKVDFGELVASLRERLKDDTKVIGVLLQMASNGELEVEHKEDKDEDDNHEGDSNNPDDDMTEDRAKHLFGGGTMAY